MYQMTNACLIYLRSLLHMEIKTNLRIPLAGKCCDQNSGGASSIIAMFLLQLFQYIMVLLYYLKISSSFIAYHEDACIL